MLSRHSVALDIRPTTSNLFVRLSPDLVRRLYHDALYENNTQEGGTNGDTTSSTTSSNNCWTIASVRQDHSLPDFLPLELIVDATASMPQILYASYNGGVLLVGSPSVANGMCTSSRVLLFVLWFLSRVARKTHEKKKNNHK